MNYSKYIDKVSEERYFKIEEMDFSIKKLSTEEEVEGFNYYTELNGAVNIAKLTLFKLTNLITTPFTKEWIKTLFKQVYDEVKEKEWSELSRDDKLRFLKGLNSDFLSSLMIQANKNQLTDNDLEDIEGN